MGWGSKVCTHVIPRLNFKCTPRADNGFRLYLSPNIFQVLLNYIIVVSNVNCGHVSTCCFALGLEMVGRLPLKPFVFVLLHMSTAKSMGCLEIMLVN